MSTPNEMPFKDNLPIKAKLAYASASTTNGILSSFAFNALTFFYNIKLGLSMEYVGLAWMIFAIWNALNDPLFGFIEDNTKSKLGRRIPYIRYGSFIYGALFIICWYPVVDLSDQLALFFNLLLVLIAFDTLFTIIGIVTYILPAEMTITAEGRSNLMVYGTILGAVGTVISQLLPTLLLLGENSSEIDPIFRPMMFVIAILCSVIMFISSYYIKENQYTQMEETLGFIEGIKETFKNKPFLIYEAGKFLLVLATTTLTTGLLYYVQYILKIGGQGIISLLPIGAVFGVAMIFTLVYNALVPKYGLKKLCIFGATWGAGGFVLCYFIGGELITAMIGFVVVGIGLAALLITTGAIIADTMDYDEIRTGKRREATYSGVEALITKPAISIANWLFLTVLAAYGFDQNTTNQSPRAENGIMVGIFLIAALLFGCLALVMTKYPLDGPQWDAEKQRLAHIHVEKEKKYLEYLKEKKSKNPTN